MPIHSWLRYGERNAIQVLCKTEDDSRWYTGGGIYRDVALLVGPKQHICPNGVKIKTVSADAYSARLQISVVLSEDEPVAVSCEISRNGNVVANVQQTVCGSGAMEAEIKNPALWSDENPALYTYRVWTDADSLSGSFGIRTLSVSPQTGLLVNGKEVKLRGACIHHDSGILGTTTYRDAEFRRVKLLKEAGFNAIRSAHHPAGRHLLDACDRLGVYVMDEAFDAWQLPKSSGDYALDFDDNWKQDMTSMVDKDYNHPCVILYSIGNEISDLATSAGVALAQQLAQYVKQLDDSRYTTVAINVHGIQAILATCPDAQDCTHIAHSLYQGSVLALGIADHDVIIRVGNQHENLLFGEEGFAGAGNTENDGGLVLQILLVAKQKIAGNGILAEVHAALFLDLLYLKGHKHRQGLGGEGAKCLDLSRSNGENCVQSVHLLEGQRRDLAHPVLGDAAQRFRQCVQLLLGVGCDDHGDGGEHHSLIPCG